MSTTTLPTVKAQLVAVLAARAGLAGVQVSAVWPGKESTEQESVWLGDARGRRDYPVVRAGRKPRDETYTLDVFIQVLRPESWDPSAETRAFELFAELEDAIAADPAIGLSATLPTLVLGAGAFTLANGVLDPGGWGALIRAEVEARARLS